MAALCIFLDATTAYIYDCGDVLQLFLLSSFIEAIVLHNKIKSVRIKFIHAITNGKL